MLVFFVGYFQTKTVKAMSIKAMCSVVTVGTTMSLRKSVSVYPSEAVQALENPGEIPLKLIEHDIV